MNQTPNYNLQKPLGEEKYNIAVINANMDLIDSALNRHDIKDNELDTKIKNHIGNKDNPHTITKAQIGLGNVDNTSDMNKPVSTAQQTALQNHNTSIISHSDIRDSVLDLTDRLNTLADSDDNTLDQLSEIIAYIKSNKSLIDSITTSKISVSDIIDTLISTAINKPLSANQGKVLKDLIDSLTDSVSTKASNSDLSSHISDKNSHITSSERTSWDLAKTHADSAHAPSNAEVNQNAFSNVKVGTTTIIAHSKTDTLELVAGSNVAITPDVTNDKVTISAKDTVYTHPVSDGNKHIPANGTSNGGKYLKATSEAGGYEWSEVSKSDVVNALGYTPGTSSTDTDTTYILSKSGNVITLTGSDGSKTTVTDSEFDYIIAKTQFAPSNGKISGMSSGTSRVYGNGLAISNPATANDVAWIRVIGTGENDTVLEIATGDDASESIVVRQYNTSNAVSREAKILDASGNTSFPGTITAPTFNGNVAWEKITGKLSTLGSLIIYQSTEPKNASIGTTWID